MILRCSKCDKTVTWAGRCNPGQEPTCVQCETKLEDTNVSGDTLLIWVDDFGVTSLYLLNWHECSVYEECDGHVRSDMDENAPELLIEHLGYMIGAEPYYGKEVPRYKNGMEVTNHDKDWVPGRPDSEPATPPWACRLIEGPVVNFRTVVRVIRTGWN